VQTWQIGDGMVVACLGGQVQVLTPGRTGFGNQTQALGVDKQWSAWQTAQLHLRRPGDLVLLMTDGVADDLPEAALPGFVRALHRELQHRNRRQARQWLRHELTYWATPGHSDDKTLVVIYKDEQHGKSREDEYGRQQEAAVGS
jgi:serine/threonine protein phosphatase PrpC